MAIATVLQQTETLVVSGSRDKKVNVWSCSSGQLLAQLCGHSDYVRSVSVSKDAKRIVSVSDDTAIRIWDLDLS